MTKTTNNFNSGSKEINKINSYEFLKYFNESIEENFSGNEIKHQTLSSDLSQFSINAGIKISNNQIEIPTYKSVNEIHKKISLTIM